MRDLSYTFWFLVAISLMFLFVPGLSFSAPFLTCDTYPASSQVDKFVIFMDSGVGIDSPAKINTDGTVTLWYDLGTVSAGIHTVKARAKISKWGVESVDSDPFTFTKPLAPAKPGGINILP